MGMGHIQIDDRYTDGKWITDLADGKVDLDSCYFHQPKRCPEYVVNRTQVLTESCYSACLLWDVANPSAYELVRSNHRALLQSGDSSEHLFCSYFDSKAEDYLEEVLSYCEDKFSNVELYLTNTRTLFMIPLSLLISRIWMQTKEMNTSKPLIKKWTLCAL